MSSWIGRIWFGIWRIKLDVAVGRLGDAGAGTNKRETGEKTDVCCKQILQKVQ
ncbi:hypothetical protein [Paenibacillus silvestris]|uniref:hypothetical protein n=1 Tax=Paenibacillus silvestris TaxID=2606219 RepID=UPI001373548C|nr:hypothetical protein [Paenibacillus silvestris]